MSVISKENKTGLKDGTDLSSLTTVPPVLLLLTQIQGRIFFLHIVIQVGGPQGVDRRWPHAHEYLGTDEECHIEVVLVALLVARARCHVEPFAAAVVAALTQAFVACWGVHLLDLVGWRDKVGKGKQCCAYSNHDTPHSQPARPLTSTAKVRDEDDHQQAADVEAADQEAGLRAAQTVALLDGGDDAAQVARNHQGLDEGQVAHAEQEATRVTQDDPHIPSGWDVDKAAERETEFFAAGACGPVAVHRQRGAEPHHAGHRGGEVCSWGGGLCLTRVRGFRLEPAAVLHGHTGLGCADQPGSSGPTALLTRTIQDGQAFGFEAVLRLHVLVLELTDFQRLRQIAPSFVIVRRSHGAAGVSALVGPCLRWQVCRSVTSATWGQRGAAAGLCAGERTALPVRLRQTELL